VACGGTVPTAAAPQTFKAEPPMTVDTKAKYVATLKTSCGTIDIVMDAAKTPHTVNSWAFLAAKGYWDGTRCHRMTSGTLNVLQCGDPTGSGSGNLGYTIPDENLTGATYPKGSVAMANTGSPHTGGGQFFINYADSQLPAQYTVVGQVTPATLAVLDKIKAVGIEGGATDGAPAQDIFLDKVTVAKQP
jgi:peptidyl-prolyl cis-trans isomerase B (cyclophilin B)